MSGLLDSTLGVVGQVGDAVDKVTGGRALRGALAGKPRELASFVPFSDTLGLTDKKDATSGRDLTDAYGLTRKGDDSFGSHAAGFLADTVLSPGNLIGGYGAFKAAPTLAKGVVAGGKALTGLDVLDHIGHGAKALGNMAFKNVDDLHGGTISALRGASDDTIRSAAGFGGDEAGSLRYHVPHKPIDIDALRSESLPANASRPRRWSTNPAERSYYSSDRSRRYAERMSGREIPRGAGPDGIPEFNLDDAFRGFASGESGAARTKRGDTYGLADPSQARKAMEAGQPVNHGPFVEPTTESGYRMKPGPIPKSKNSAPVPKPSAPLPPKHGPDSDLLEAYEAMTKGFRKDAPMETYVIPDEARAEASAHSGEFAREASDTLNQYNAARDLTPNLLDRITSRFKNPVDLWKHFSGGFVGGEGGFLKVPIPGVDHSTANAQATRSPLLLSDPGFGHEISSFDRSAQPPQGGFSIHSGGTDKLARGLLSRFVGGGSSPAAAEAATGVELPWQRAVRIGNEAGFPTSKITPREATATRRMAGWSAEDFENTMAWYSSKRNKIELNPFQQNWYDNAAMNSHLHEHGPENTNWFSSSHPDHVINHEIGHGMHAQSVGADRFQFDPEINTPFEPGSDEHNFFRSTVGEAGAIQPDETIAEIVAALKGGRELNPSLIPALKEWGGPHMFQNLGDQGLLKGLGLSLLATLGIGGAAAQPQGS